MKTLTIGIPTYNGAAPLAKNLQNLTAIIKDCQLEKTTTILVSINGSTDNSTRICREFARKFDFVKYHVHEGNIGFDGNCHSIVSISETPYVWLLSDNETITPKGLLAALKALENQPDYVFMNYGDSITTLSGKNAIQYFNDPRLFINALRYKSGLISSNIVSKHIWTQSPMTRYFNGWIHIGYLIEVLNRGRINAVICSEQSLQHIDAEHGHAWGQGGAYIEVGFRLVEMVLEHLRADNPEGVYWAKRAIGGGYPENIIRARLHGLKVTKSIRERAKLASSYNMARYYLLVFPSLVCPAFILRLAVLAFGAIKRKIHNPKSIIL